jgi:hypothetical protein
MLVGEGRARRILKMRGGGVPPGGGVVSGSCAPATCNTVFAHLQLLFGPVNTTQIPR